MLMTPLRDILGIGVPIILASTGRARSAEFTAAASNEGALGSIELLNRASAAVMRDIEGEGELPRARETRCAGVLKNLTARLSPREQVSPIHPGILHTMSSPGVIVDGRCNRHHRRRHDATCNFWYRLAWFRDFGLSHDCDDQLLAAALRTGWR
jgi:hypothetical protein